MFFSSLLYIYIHIYIIYIHFLHIYTVYIYSLYYFILSMYFFICFLYIYTVYILFIYTFTFYIYIYILYIYIYIMYSMIWIYILQSQYGQDSGFHFLMAFIKFFMESILFKYDGIVSQIFGRRYFRLSKPWFTGFSFGIISCDLLLKLYCSRRDNSNFWWNTTMYFIYFDCKTPKIFMVYGDRFIFT